MKAETKFNVNQKVWTLVNFKARECNINSIDLEIRAEVTKIKYWLKPSEKEDGLFAIEENVFATREELIESI